jgi:small subunit ribosomal protein S1
MPDQPDASDADTPHDDDALLEAFLRDPGADYRHAREGMALDGIILTIRRDQLVVDVGAKSEGVVEASEMQSLDAEARAALRPGDALLVYVMQSEDREGRVVLSVDRARQERSWRRLQELKDADGTIEARVVGNNRGGLLVNLDGVRGFVPASQVSSIGRGDDAQKQADMARLIGSTLTLKVVEIQRARNRLILSERQAAQNVRETRKGELMGTLREGEIRSGIVTSVYDFGVFVDIGGADGLVHVSELSWSRVQHPSHVLTPGDRTQVMVLGVDQARRRIALSIKRTMSAPWTTIAERYQVGQQVVCEITRLTAFGAFARIEEGIEGLIHISELSEARIAHPGDVVSEGATVSARIVRIEPARKRIGLSLRAEDATSGTAGDPA